MRSIGSELAAKRRIHERPCAECGAPVRGTARRRYCSGRCKLRAFRRGRTDTKASAAPLVAA